MGRERIVKTPWGQVARQWVTAMLISLGIMAVFLLRPLVLPLTLALLLAYILNPVIDAMDRATRLPRILSAALVYLLLIVLLSLAPISFVPEGFFDWISRAQIDLNRTLESMRQVIASYGPFQVAGFAVDPAQIYELALNNLAQSLSKIAPRSLDIFFGVATGFATTVLWIVFILVVSFYIVKDSPAILRYIDAQLPPGYREEVWSLIHRIGDTWNAFLRGQLVLGIVVGTTVGVCMALLGVQNAVVLGVLAGVMEIVPNLGPVLASIPAILIAFFQGSSHLAISNGWFALVVIVTYVLIQQVENNVLVPRIIGGSVDLHPVVVLIGAIVGASVAGILGMFLAAPTMATVRILAGYAYGKLIIAELPEQPVAEAAPITSKRSEESDRDQGEPDSP